jgi:hypothetical protein
MSEPLLTKRRRPDRERLLQQLPGFPKERVEGLESWDVDYGELEASVIMSREDISTDMPSDWRWHISISGKDRVPNWGEMAGLLHKLRPGIVFCLGVPPRSWWINVAENCLHAWELRDDALIEQWRSERQGDTPT